MHAAHGDLGGGQVKGLAPSATLHRILPQPDDHPTHTNKNTDLVAPMCLDEATQG